LARNEAANTDREAATHFELQEAMRLQLLEHHKKLQEVRGLSEAAKLAATKDRDTLMHDHKAALAAAAKAGERDRTAAELALEKSKEVRLLEHHEQLQQMQGLLVTAVHAAVEDRDALVREYKVALAAAADAAERDRSAAELVLQEAKEAKLLENHERMQEIEGMLEVAELAVVEDHAALVKEHEAEVSSLEVHLNAENFQAAETIRGLEQALAVAADAAERDRSAAELVLQEAKEAHLHEKLQLRALLEAGELATVEDHAALVHAHGITMSDLRQRELQAHDDDAWSRRHVAVLKEELVVLCGDNAALMEELVVLRGDNAALMKELAATNEELASCKVRVMFACPDARHVSSQMYLYHLRQQAKRTSKVSKSRSRPCTTVRLPVSRSKNRRNCSCFNTSNGSCSCPTKMCGYGNLWWILRMSWRRGRQSCRQRRKKAQRNRRC
jgi:hypothetical protein